MPLYINHTGKLKEVKEKPFKLEKDIQKVFEANLYDIMGLELVKSEFTIKNKRIDTLAYDTQASAFIIIEYKRDKNISVVDQGFTYLSLMLENKADFIVEYNESLKRNLKREDVDWSQTRVAFVSTNFTDNQVQATNFKDIALLKFKNIDGEFIRFMRAKTLHTNRSDARPITVHISDEINQIIIRWGNSNTDLDNFIFPIIESGATPEREAALIKQFTKNVNHYLKYIAAELGIARSLSTYYARHSFATILKRGGASVDLISESLGHSSIKTTASYLDSFDDDTKRDMQALLLQF